MQGFLVVLVLAVAVSTVYGDGECPKDWTRKGRKCYKLLNQNKNFDQAEHTCKEHGGHLACPKSAEENVAIHEIAQNMRYVCCMNE